jgi:hypothetical protein
MDHYLSEWLGIVRERIEVLMDVEVLVPVSNVLLHKIVGQTMET